MILTVKPSSYYLSWHKVFAWWPIEIRDGEVAWLETVHRRYTWRGASGQYYGPQYRSHKAMLEAGEVK